MKTFLFLLFCFILAVGFPANPSYSNELSSKVKIKKNDSLVFTLFPNPVKNKILFIESSSEALKHIEIYDVLGTMKFSSETYENRIPFGRAKNRNLHFCPPTGRPKRSKKIDHPISLFFT
jgi:hypothetical protein